MPIESLRSSESNNKRKVKNKIPKRLRRKNKPNDINTEENIIPIIDDLSLTKRKTIQESAPFSLNTSSINIDNNLSIDKTSIYYWRNCTKKALDILEKQRINRRKFFIERHQERIESIQCIIYQREQLNKLIQENDFIRNELCTKDETIKILENKLYDYNERICDNDFLRIQLKLMEQKFDRFTIEYNQKLEENRQHEHEYNEQIQSLMDEIERIKRDLILEEYRKQEAERKVRYYDEKSKNEQNLNKKMQQDIIQLKQELKSIHIKYDSLQIEMLEMHKANNNDISLIPTKDTNEWIKKRTIDDENDEQQLENKRLKRKTRDRTESSASTTSNSSDKQNKIPIKNKDDLTVKRKTLKSKKTIKTHLPMLTITQASPSIDSNLLSTQLQPPPSITSDSQDTSYESQTSKKQTRYPCRRAQRPVKQTNTNDQIKQ